MSENFRSNKGNGNFQYCEENEDDEEEDECAETQEEDNVEVKIYILIV